MPFENLHGCRVRDPGRFRPKSFRTLTRMTDGKELRMIVGKLKGQEKTTLQSYRMPTKDWTEQEAREFCKNHQGKLFESATGSKQSKLSRSEGVGKGERMEEHELMIRSQARRPTYDGTESSDWSAPTLMSFVDGWLKSANKSRSDFKNGELDEVKTLPQAAKAWIAARTLLGEASATDYRNLAFFPVVDPATNNLNENALRAVIGARGSQAKIPAEAKSSAQRMARRLLEDEYDMDENALGMGVIEQYSNYDTFFVIRNRKAVLLDEKPTELDPTDSATFAVVKIVDKEESYSATRMRDAEVEDVEYRAKRMIEREQEISSVMVGQAVGTHVAEIDGKQITEEVFREIVRYQFKKEEAKEEPETESVLSYSESSSTGGCTCKVEKFSITGSETADIADHGKVKLRQQLRKEGKIEHPNVSFAIETHQSEDLGENEFTGMASVFNVLIDTYVPTKILPGAFKKTLRENKGRIKILSQHNTDDVIGKPVEMYETDDGLFVRGKISDTSVGRDVLTLMRDGVITELSIGFDPVSFRFEEQGGEMVRLIDEVRLWEFSPVTFGANREAKIMEVNQVAKQLIRKIPEDVDRQAVEALKAQLEECLHACQSKAEQKPAEDDEQDKERQAKLDELDEMTDELIHVTGGV